MLPMMKYLCRILGHRRLRNAVQFNSAEQCYESVCKRCHVKMLRTCQGDWSVVGELVD